MKLSNLGCSFDVIGVLCCICQALEFFRQSVLDLYRARRIEHPVWLSMMTMTSTHKVKLCKHFLKEFVIAKERYDRNNRL